MELRDLTGPNGESVNAALKSITLLTEDLDEDLYNLIRETKSGDLLKGLSFCLWAVGQHLSGGTPPVYIFEDLRRSLLEDMKKSYGPNLKVLDLLIAIDGPASIYYLKLYSVEDMESVMAGFITLFSHIARQFLNMSVEELSESVSDYMKTLL